MLHATRAIELWSAEELVYGFQWIARFPLLAVCHEAGDDATAAEQVRFLLGKDQQRLPPDIEAALAAGDIPTAIGHGERLGYA